MLPRVPGGPVGAMPSPRSPPCTEAHGLPGAFRHVTMGCPVATKPMTADPNAKMPVRKYRVKKSDTKHMQRILREIVPRDAEGRVIRPVLNPQHLAVVDNYFENGFDRYQAMTDAGYAHKTARARNQTIFERPEVVAEVAWRREQMARRWEVTQENLLGELAKLAFSNLPDIMEKIRQSDGGLDLSGLEEQERAAIAEFIVEDFVTGRGEWTENVRKVKIKTHDKLGAIDKLMRHLGLYNDKLNIQGEINILDKLNAGRARMKKIVELPDGSTLFVEGKDEDEDAQE